MRNKEQESNTWNECSWNKFNIKGRKYWYEDDICDISNDSYPFVLSYGSIENINLSNCYGIEDWFDIVEEYN